MDTSTQHLNEIRDIVKTVLSSKLAANMPLDLRAEQIALAVTGEVVPKLVGQELRQAADDYEKAMDDDAMYTSTWGFLRARADEMDPDKD